MPIGKTKGASGPGKGISTSGRSEGEDSPGWDPRIQGDRRYGKGARLPGGKVAGKDHGVRRDWTGAPYTLPGMPGQGVQIGTAITQRPGQSKPEEIKKGRKKSGGSEALRRAAGNRLGINKKRGS